MPNKRGLLRNLFSRWAETDPAAALQAAGKVNTPRDDFYSSIASQWATKDPAAVIAWLKTLPENSRKRNLMRQVSYSISAADPKLAAEFAASLPPGEGRSEAISAVASQLAYTDLASAIDWVKQITDPASQATGAAKYQLPLGTTGSTGCRRLWANA